jgi:very-short-patch-repair endonuclease
LNNEIKSPRYIIDLGKIHENRLGSDAYRDEYFNSLGIVTLRVTNEDIAHDLDDVCEKIRKKLQELH